MWLFTLAGCGRGPSQPAPTARLAGQQRYEYVEQKMGAGFRIVLYAPDKATADRAAQAALGTVDRLNPILSDYQVDSEINRLSAMTNDGPMRDFVDVSPPLCAVIRESLRAAQLSGGAFDITVGPYMRLWRRSRQMWELPTADRLARTRESVGYQLIDFDEAKCQVRLRAKSMHLDASGIAVGYVNDQCLKAMRDVGVSKALIDAGGDLICGDPPPGAAGWRVAVQSLVKPNDIVFYATLSRAAISTSGDTYRFVEIDGKRYSHIVDPKTGLGLSNRIGVTAIAPDGVTCDWIDTAVAVMGPAAGIEMVEKIPGASVRVTTAENESIRVYESKRFSEHRIEEARSTTRGGEPADDNP